MSETAKHFSKGRALRWLCAGVLAAAVVSSVLSAVTFKYWDADQPDQFQIIVVDVLNFATGCWLIYCVVFALCSVAWLGLYRTKLRGWATASSLGFCATFVPLFLLDWSTRSYPVKDLSTMVIYASIPGFGGAIVVVAAWWAAYRVSGGAPAP